jgi:hypothetical protein
MLKHEYAATILFEEESEIIVCEHLAAYRNPGLQIGRYRLS